MSIAIGSKKLVSVVAMGVFYSLVACAEEAPESRKQADAAVPAATQAESGHSEIAGNYYQTVAEQGDPYAQMALGEMYLRGEGLQQDYFAAYAWLYTASSQGVEEARELLAEAKQSLPEHLHVQAEALGKEYVKNYTAND